jgi:hypothetical protein
MRLSTTGTASERQRPPTGHRFAALSSAAILGAACLGGATTFVGASAHTFGSPATTPNPSSGPAGTALGDTAHLNEDTTADRTIRFQLFDNAQCSGNPVFTDEVPAPQDDGAAEDGGTDNVVTDETFTANTPGTYQWVASIVAPTGAVETHTNCGDEPVTITTGGVSGTTTTSTTKTDTDTDTDTTSKTTTTKSTTTTTSGSVSGISTSTTSTKSTTTGGSLGITTGGVSGAPNTGSDLPLGEALALIIPGLGLAGLGLRSVVRRKVPPA